MLDPRFVAENPDTVVDHLRRRNADEDTLARLTAHAGALEVPVVIGPSRWQAVALAAVALLAISVGRWTVPPAQSVGTLTAEDIAWLDSDDMEDGLDLLVLPLESHDPKRALEVVDALIAELDDA